MNNLIKYIFMAFLMAACLSCVDDGEKDDQLPEIDMTAAEAFPQNCDTVYRGESFSFIATFTDNVELGSFSIEMHNNFNHHTHSTDIAECEMDPVKSPVNPLLFIEEFDIPGGLKNYTATIEIEIPSDVDTGDYHFMIRLADAAGWQALKGISVKVSEK